ncbi:hypothetical protein, partial [Salmonella enterica]|uniref:hypothetical protein n=1 Tax=Salmonella enterica TaxID=28901 RepID=UPI003D299701
MLQVKNHIWVFVNALIENSTFDSQTKENMTLQTKSFGSKCLLSEKFIRAVRTLLPCFSTSLRLLSHVNWLGVYDERILSLCHPQATNCGIVESILN